MPLFVWSKMLETGIKEMDGQHRGLVKWMNRFHKCHMAGDTAKALVALQRLEQLTVDHFAAEEAMLQARCFPGLAEHRVHHTRLLTMLNHLVVRYRNDPTKKRGESIGGFLRAWLNGHIMGVDKKYGNRR